MSYPCPKCGKPLVKSGFTPGGRQRWKCKTYAGTDTGDNGKYCHGTTDPTLGAARKQDGSLGSKREPDKHPVFSPSLKGYKRFLVTAAQNATPAHKGFLAALEGAARALGAQLVVIPLRYKNPTSKWTASQANEESWAPELAPYLCNVRKALGPNLTLLADIKTQPTAVRPLTGFESLTGHQSAILGHTKLQFTTVPAPAHKLAKILTTTGAVTVPNFTDSVSGKKGAFHHVLGACMVELDGKEFHLRQILGATDGSFTDWDREYLPDGTNRLAPPAAALVLGDTHVDVRDPKVDKATFGDGGIVDQLKPDVLVYHDLSDEGAVNPHTRDNPFVAVARHDADLTSVEAEVHRAIGFVFERSLRAKDSVIVPSNHNDFLQRWLAKHDWRLDPENARFYLRSALAMIEAKEGERGDIFAYWMREHVANSALRGPVTVLNRDESYTVKGIELGMHGDIGPNGSRGSRMNLRRIGVKSIIGHSHSPGIEEGCYQVGTSSILRPGYNRGPSSWLQTHCVVYASGKRTLVTIVGGRCRARRV